MQKFFVFFFYDLAGPVRDDEPELYPLGHIHRVLSGMGATALSSLPASPSRVGRAAVQAGDDVDPPSSQTGVGAPCPWQPTTDLTPERVNHFWQSVNASTCLALEKHHTVIISSHLLTGNRARRLLACIEENGLTVQQRTYRIPFTPAMRALMQLEILFRQWRWRTDFRTYWPVLILRSKTF